MVWIRHYLTSTMPQIAVSDGPVPIPTLSTPVASVLQRVASYPSVMLTEAVRKFIADTPPMNSVQPKILRLLPPIHNRRALRIQLDCTPALPGQVKQLYTAFGATDAIAGYFDQYILPTIAYLMHPRSLAPPSQFQEYTWKDDTRLDPEERTPGVEGDEFRWKYLWEKLAVDGTPEFELRNEKRILRDDMHAWHWKPFDASAGTGTALLVASTRSLLTPAVFNYLVLNRELSAPPKDKPKAKSKSKASSKSTISEDDRSKRLADDYLKRVVNCCAKLKTRHFIITTENNWAFGVFPCLTPEGGVDYSRLEISLLMLHNSETCEEGMEPLPVQGTSEVQWTVGVLPTVMYWLDKAMFADAPDNTSTESEGPDDPVVHVTSTPRPQPVAGPSRTASASSKKRSREPEAEDALVSDEQEAGPSSKRPRHTAPVPAKKRRSLKPKRTPSPVPAPPASIIDYVSQEPSLPPSTTTATHAPSPSMTLATQSSAAGPSRKRARDDDTDVGGPAGKRARPSPVREEEEEDVNMRDVSRQESAAPAVPHDVPMSSQVALTAAPTQITFPFVIKFNEEEAQQAAPTERMVLRLRASVQPQLPAIPARVMPVLAPAALVQPASRKRGRVVKDSGKKVQPRDIRQADAVQNIPRPAAVVRATRSQVRRGVVGLEPLQQDLGTRRRAAKVGGK